MEKILELIYGKISKLILAFLHIKLCLKNLIGMLNAFEK